MIYSETRLLLFTPTKHKPFMQTDYIMTDRDLLKKFMQLLLIHTVKSKHPVFHWNCKSSATGNRDSFKDIKVLVPSFCVHFKK